MRKNKIDQRTAYSVQRSGKSRSRFTPTLLFIPLFILILASSAFAAEGGKQTVNKIAAIVNNDIITEAELNKAIASLDRQTSRSKSDAIKRQEVLDILIDDKLFGQIMTKSKMEVNDDDLAKAIANVLHRNRITIEQLKGEIAGKGISYDEYKKSMITEIKKAKFITQTIGPQVKISDQDLRDYYQRNHEQFRGSKSAHIAKISLPVASAQTQSDFDKILETAQSIVAKSRGGLSFAALAKQYSNDDFAGTGGDLGMVNIKTLPPEMAAAVQGLKIGETSNPFLLGDSLVIVKLISLPEVSTEDFDKMRDEIYQALYDKKMEETMRNYLSKERERSFIEIR